MGTAGPVVQAVCWQEGRCGGHWGLLSRGWGELHPGVCPLSCGAVQPQSACLWPSRQAMLCAPGLCAVTGGKRGASTSKAACCSLRLSHCGSIPSHPISACTASGTAEPGLCLTAGTSCSGGGKEEMRYKQLHRKLKGCQIAFCGAKGDLCSGPVGILWQSRCFLTAPEWYKCRTLCHH